MNASDAFDKLRPVLSRFLAIPVGALVAWIIARYTLDFDAGTRAALTSQIINGIIEIISVMLAVYVTVHKTANVKINPSDSASPSMSKAASGPMGSGERERLGEHMEAVAEGNPASETAAPGKTSERGDDD